jgi:hypothetical protein
MNEASNITLDGLVFDYTYKAGDDINMRPFQVNSSSNIVIKNSTFDGDVASGSTELDQPVADAELLIRVETLQRLAELDGELGFVKIGAQLFEVDRPVVRYH